MSEIKEDFLEVDSKIPGQNYVCLSFVSPEKILKQKEIFNVTKFLEYLLTDEELVAKDTRSKMLNNELKINYENINQLYGDWKYSRAENLESDFFEKNNYQTSMRGLKIRGVYDTHREANVRAQLLRKKDPSFNVFVGQVGYWLPWDPEAEAVQEQEYQEGQLNELVKKYKENLTSRDDLYEQEKNEKIEKAKKEVNAKKEALKKENEEATISETTSEDVKNIEKLREIVDESDKAYYDNLKKHASGEVSIDASVEVPVEVPVEAHVDETDYSDMPELISIDESQLSDSSKSEIIKSLEEEDPWLARRKKEE
jgi:hypothetical protein